MADPALEGVLDSKPVPVDTLLHDQSKSALFDLAKTPINLETLRQELIGYDLQTSTEIFQGFSSGFPLHYSGSRAPSDSKNLKSAKTNPDIVRQKIQSEIEAGRVAGPFDTRPMSTLRVSPLGLVPKRDPGKY